MTNQANRPDNASSLCSVCVFASPVGPVGISKWAYLDSSLCFSIHAATKRLLWQTSSTSCAAVTDVTLATDIQMTWCMKSTWLLQWNRSLSKWIFLVAGPLKVIRIFLLVHVNVNMARCSVVTLLSLNNYNSVCPCYNKIQILYM